MNKVILLGKVRGEKWPFDLGQGMSRKVRETGNGQGKIVLLYCRSGKICHFWSSLKCLIF